ncbi:hypothetical protein TWF696_000255 [Orbilia brochopaga]|uniref:Uncharacterized protein n=1 Tax=Orbilia brochopaga TaxID=3140254 RepID=A0AAV9VDG0_9PEZI
MRTDSDTSSSSSSGSSAAAPESLATIPDPTPSINIDDIANEYPPVPLAPELFTLPDWLAPFNDDIKAFKTEIFIRCDSAIKYTIGLLDRLNKALSQTMHYFCKLVEAVTPQNSRLVDLNVARSVSARIDQRLHDLRLMEYQLQKTLPHLTIYVERTRVTAMMYYDYNMSEDDLLLDGQNSDLRDKINDLTKIIKSINETAFPQIERMVDMILLFRQFDEAKLRAQKTAFDISGDWSNLMA